MEVLIENITKWANDRNIINGATSQSQCIKLIEEFGELAGNIARGKDIKDDIGDMIVVLTILAAQNNVTIKECVEVAYNDIKFRKGKMINGIFVKEKDLT